MSEGVSYFGEPVEGGESNLIGRFIPARLGVAGTARLASSCGPFSYQGQPMGFASGAEPQIRVTAYNSAGVVTRNYDIAPFWRLGSPQREAYRSITGKAGLDSRLVALGSATETVEEADTGDGSRLYRWAGEQLSYTPAVTPTSDDIPFVAAVEQTLTAGGLTDLDGACHSSVGSGCQAYSYPFAAGSEVRLGRLVLGNAHGSELQGLDLPLSIETWQTLGTAPGFRLEAGDQCTTAATLGQITLQAHGGEIAPSDTTASLVMPAGGQGTLSLTAPGQGNDGSLKVGLPSMPDWFRYNWSGNGREPASGLASFGIYRGSPPLIFRREVYR